MTGLSRRQFVAGLVGVATAARHHRTSHKPGHGPPPPPPPSGTGVWLSAYPGYAQPGAFWLGGAQ